MKTLYAFILFIFIGSTTYAQAAKDKKQIEATVVRFFDGISALSETAMKAEVTADFCLVEHGLVWNVDSLITNLKPMIGQNIKRVNLLVFDKTDQIGDFATVVYHNTAELTMGDKKRTIKWLESAVLLKKGGQWKIKLLHSTDLK